MFPFGYLPSVCNTSDQRWDDVLFPNTCVEMQAHLPKWTQNGSEQSRKRDKDRHGLTMNGSVLRADYIAPRLSMWGFYDYTLRELADLGWGATGWDMVAHVAFEECDPAPVITECECGAHVPESKWEDHNCYVVRGDAHLAEMMG